MKRQARPLSVRLFPNLLLFVRPREGLEEEGDGAALVVQVELVQDEDHVACG